MGLAGLDTPRTDPVTELRADPPPDLDDGRPARHSSSSPILGELPPALFFPFSLDVVARRPVPRPERRCWCSAAALCLQSCTASHRPRSALLWSCVRTHIRSQPFPCLELLTHALAGVFRRADPPPPPRSLLQASPGPDKAASRLRISRRSTQSQTSVGLTPGMPYTANSDEFLPRAAAENEPRRPAPPLRLQTRPGPPI